MKRIVFLSLFILYLVLGFSQSPVYYFTISIDTAYEGNASVIAGYVKTDNAPSAIDSVVVILIAGSPRPTHIDTTSRYVLYFNPGQDSVAFAIQIMKDTFPEYPEHVQYVLRSSASGSIIGADSLLEFVLIDNTPPAIISFITDSTWCYESNDSVVNGVYFPYGNVCGVGITINNPNPFYVRYLANSIGLYNNIGYPFVTAIQYDDYYFNPETCYAAPGVTTYYKGAYLTNENSTSNKYFICRIQNIDANTIIDSFSFFTIEHVNYFDTPTLSFDTRYITVVEDSLQSIGIPITISNPNRKPLYFHIDTIQSSSSFPGINYTFDNQGYGYGNGISHDTLWVNFINSHLIYDTISMTFALRNDSVNSSPDTLITITVVDTGTLQVSFLGAGFSHLKSDSVGYVQVVTSSPAKFPVSVFVSYLNGNAVRDTDFIFTDTTITFPAYFYDTISLPVIMLQDHIHSGNTQVNLQLSDVSPSTVQYGIIQYSYIIVDDEDSGLAGLGINNIDNDGGNIKIHPNPVENDLYISATIPKYNITLSNEIGENAYTVPGLPGENHLDISALPAGLYYIKISNQEISYTKKLIKLQ